jgi:carboxyl-terminal processing protease
MDLLKRYEHGEFFSAGSIKQNEDEVFKTKGGRTVYGGGGITPDIFVAQDTTGYSEYYANVVRKSLINKFSFKYVDSNRAALSKLKTYKEVEEYLDSDNVMRRFYDYAAGNGVKRDSRLTLPARRQMRTALYGNIIYDALDMQDYISFINLTDPTVTKAIEVLK